MTDVLERLIEDSLGRHAATVYPGPRLDAEELIVAGGRARRRRRAVLAAVVVVVLAIGGGALAVLHRHRTPPPSTIAPPTTLDSLGLDVLSASHGVIIRTNDGLRVRIASPDAAKVVRATRVPGGWVAEAALSATTRRLLFVHSDGSTQTIATFDATGNYMFSADGRTLVVTQVDDPSGQRVLDIVLPSIDRAGALEGAVPRTLVIAIVGGLVLLSEPIGADGPFVTSEWVLDGARPVPTPPDSVAVLGASARGDVLVARAVRDAHDDQIAACVSVVPLTAMDRAEQAPATCHPATANPTGTISPDGREAFLDGPTFRGLYRVADLRAGNAVATAVSASFADFHVDGYAQPWLTIPLDPRVVLVAPGPAGTPRFIACDTVAACGELPFPSGLDDPVPVPQLLG